MHLTEDDLCKILEILPLGVLFVDGDGVVVATNTLFADGWGGEKSEIQGRSIKEFVVLPEKKDSHASESLSRLAGTYLSARMLDSRGVSVPCNLGVVETSNPHWRHFLFFEPESSKKLHKQQQLASLGSIAGGIAHDLNNVLTGVLGHISYLRLALPEQAEYSESIVAIEDGARRAAGMVNTVLDFARGEESEHSKVNLNLVVAAGINLLRAALPKNISIATQESAEIFIQGDESQLSQLVMNFIVNARDALPNGGTIHIHLELQRVQESKRVSRGALRAGDYALMRIKDNGVGIPPDLRDKIFDPFFTTKREEGTGLGLATVWQIVEDHGGAIDLRSSADEGTEFAIYFPQLSLAAPELSRSSATTKQGPAKGQGRILVVDDEEAVRAVVQRALELIGYDVEVASNGSEALEIYQTQDFDLVVLDMMMPGLSGDEVFFELRKLDSEAKVLLASGYASDQRTSAVLEAGGKGFIQKPFDVEELAEKVKQCLS